jgi:hypothetical protein
LFCSQCIMPANAQPGFGPSDSAASDFGMTCSVCGLWDDDQGEVEFYRVREEIGSPRTICDDCVSRVGPFAEYEVFLDEVPWLLRQVAALSPGRRVIPETSFVDASALVRLKVRSVPVETPPELKPIAAR